MTTVSAEAQERRSVQVLLTTAPAVTGEARAALIRETTRIWKNAGVRLAWSSPTTPGAGLSLRVLIVEQTGPAGGHDASVLGELVRGAGTTAAAMVALDRAAAIATRGSIARGSLTFDQRLGLILGRAVAHEIGHFLLAGSPHQREGLMRAHFPENELADAWSTTFELNAAMQPVARTTVANGLPRRVPAPALPAVMAGPTD